MWEVFTLNSTPMKWRGNRNVCFHSHDGVDSRNLLEHVQTATHQEGSSGRRVRQHAPDHRTVWKHHQGTAKQKNKFILVTVWVCCEKNKTKKTTLKKSVMCNIKCCDPLQVWVKGQQFCCLSAFGSFSGECPLVFGNIFNTLILPTVDSWLDQKESQKVFFSPHADRQSLREEET